MAVKYEGYRHDITLFGAGTGTSLVEPKVGTLVPYRKGATITADGSIAGAGVDTVNVSDVGTIGAGDIVQVEGQGATGVASPLNATQISVNWTAAASWQEGQRLTLSAVAQEVEVYKDPYLTLPLSTPITTPLATGRVSAYSRQKELDFVITVDSVVSIIPDSAGIGGRFEISPLDTGAKFDASTNDGDALARAIQIIKFRQGGVLELPPGNSHISGNVTISGINGLEIRGQGKGISKILLDAAATQWLLSSATDITLKDLSLGRLTPGSAALLSIAATCMRVKFENVHFTDGSLIAVDSGVETSYLNCSADNDSWTGGILFDGAKRPYVERLTARYANSLGASAGFLHFDGPCESPRLSTIDIAPSDIANFSGSPILVTNSKGVGVAGPSDIVIGGAKLVGGNDPTPGARSAVVVQNASGAGDDPSGLTMTDVQCEDSLMAMDFQGGQAIMVRALRSVGMIEGGVRVRDGARHVTIDGVESSHIGNAENHVLVDGAAEDVSVSNVRGGNYLRSTSGNNGLSVVRVEDGAGERIFIGPNITFDVNEVSQTTSIQKSAARSDIHEYHNQDPSSTPFTPVHDGFAYRARFYSGDETVLDAESIGLIEVDYSASIVVTNIEHGRSGQMLFFANVGSNSVDIQDNANFTMLSAGDLTVAPLQTVIFFRSSISSKAWIQLPNPAA